MCHITEPLSLLQGKRGLFGLNGILGAAIGEIRLSLLLVVNSIGSNITKYHNFISVIMPISQNCLIFAPFL